MNKADHSGNPPAAIIATSAAGPVPTLFQPETARIQPQTTPPPPTGRPAATSRQLDGQIIAVNDRPPRIPGPVAKRCVPPVVPALAKSELWL
ncbi:MULTISPECIES: hypothetical protein [Lysobacter]|uniref:hypothetical protein n=1 Tax=Lysobacter TaxID=68 RepID=UPI001F25F6A1|nr:MULTISPECIES: hypothetical protein [Lysobacter]UJB18186.1 hypothetical protein L1A79_17790 [Lysobacter capsici]UJQ28091.1 hypothetical protein L2D09_22095 [Lysobacter gummosus]